MRFSSNFFLYVLRNKVTFLQKRMTKSSILRSTVSKSGGSGADKTTNLNALVAEKSPFLLRVFATFGVQLGISFYVMWLSMSKEELRSFALRNRFFIGLFQIAIIFMLALLPIPPSLKLVLFTLFSIMNGLIVPLYAPDLSTRDVVDSAFQTFLLFLTMAAVGLLVVRTGVDTTLFEFSLVVMSFGMIAWGVYLVFFQSKESQRKNLTWYRNLTILLFALYIVYDTYNILRVDYEGDFVTAAFDYYLDVFNIFKSLLVLDNSDD